MIQSYLSTGFAVLQVWLHEYQLIRNKISLWLNGCFWFRPSPPFNGIFHVAKQTPFLYIIANQLTGLGFLFQFSYQGERNRNITWILCGYLKSYSYNWLPHNNLPCHCYITVYGPPMNDKTLGLVSFIKSWSYHLYQFYSHWSDSWSLVPVLVGCSSLGQFFQSSLVVPVSVSITRLVPVSPFNFWEFLFFNLWSDNT